jgi:hypothetical protein
MSHANDGVKTTSNESIAFNYLLLVLEQIRLIANAAHFIATRACGFATCTLCMHIGTVVESVE